MRQIHSRHFQICRIDKYWQEYWRILYVKIRSRDYSSIYARTSKIVDEYSVFTCSRLFSKNWRKYRSGFALWCYITCLYQPLHRLQFRHTLPIHSNILNYQSQPLSNSVISSLLLNTYCQSTRTKQLNRNQPISRKTIQPSTHLPVRYSLFNNEIISVIFQNNAYFFNFSVFEIFVLTLKLLLLKCM